MDNSWKPAAAAGQGCGPDHGRGPEHALALDPRPSSRPSFSIAGCGSSWEWFVQYPRRRITRPARRAVLLARRAPRRAVLPTLLAPRRTRRRAGPGTATTA